MNSASLRIVLLGVLLACSLSTRAAGTAAGTTISNTATVNYDVAGIPATANSSTSITVLELLDLVVTWQDAANIASASPDTDRVLTFLVSNTGNGSETVRLTTNAALAGDNFDPGNIRIYLDNGNGTFDGLGSEILYSIGVNDPVLDANAVASVQVYVVADIPPGQAAAALGDVALTALAQTAGAAGAAAGTTLVNAGDGGLIDAIVGNSNADGSATGRYEVQPVAVTLSKSASIIVDGAVCTVAPCQPVPGAIIEYTIQAQVSGAGIAESLVVTDPVPVNSSYRSNSLLLDAVAQSDGADADAGSVVGNIVSVNLGNVTAPATHTIVFQVSID